VLVMAWSMTSCGFNLRKLSTIAGVKIDASLLKPEEAEILEDLIIAAHADAKAKVEELMKDKMRSLTGGLPLPPGMKLFY
jgi:DNA-binding protein YbaB